MLTDQQLTDFFRTGFYEACWTWEFSEAESRALAEKSVQLLDAHSGHILDWCGGWGRISRHLLQQGFKVTILDFTERYLAMAKEACGGSPDLVLIHADCRNTPAEIQADYALCTFNSVGFLADPEQLKAFRSLRGALKSGAKVIVDCMNQLCIARHFLPVMENVRPDGVRCVKTHAFDVRSSALVSEFTLVSPSGELLDQRHFEQRLYTPHELGQMLAAAGFEIRGMWGDFDRNPLDLDRPQIVAVAQIA